MKQKNEPTGSLFCVKGYIHMTHYINIKISLRGVEPPLLEPASSSLPLTYREKVEHFSLPSLSILYHFWSDLSSIFFRFFDIFFELFKRAVYILLSEKI